MEAGRLTADLLCSFKSNPPVSPSALRNTCHSLPSPSPPPYLQWITQISPPNLFLSTNCSILTYSQLKQALAGNLKATVTRKVSRLTTDFSPLFQLLQRQSPSLILNSVAALLLWPLLTPPSPFPEDEEDSGGTHYHLSSCGSLQPQLTTHPHCKVSAPKTKKHIWPGVSNGYN